MLSVFVLAVFTPSVILSLLALRAADRESLYVERRLEETLLAEADLVARRIEEAMSAAAAALEREAGRLSPSNPLVEAPFTLQDGRLSLPDLPLAVRRDFMDSFGAFLRDGARLPVYDSVVRVYRKEIQTPRSGSGGKIAGDRAPAPRPQAADLSALSEPRQESLSLAEIEGEAAAGFAQKSMKSLAAAAPAPNAREDAFQQASREGFEILYRNVVSQKRQSEATPERSKTVARSRAFSELLAESDGGLLPRLSDRGLEILFWTKLGEGVVGCTLRMDALRERIAEALPDAVSEARLLAVLDDRGFPVVEPALPGSMREPPDWRRPFVAREISSLLPRWEVGAWLTDPGALTSRVRFTTLAVWILVAALFLLIAVGSLAVLWMLSSEMRVAGQKTTFVANVSHELKTPLTSIRLFAELLLSGRQADEGKRREYLRTMMSEVDRLARLVDNVLAFSRRGKGKEKYSMQTLSLTDLTRETLAQLEPHLTKNGFTVAAEAEGDPLPVTGDREALRQVVMNLLSNAEKYAGENREIRVSCRAENGFAVAEVADRGIGVEPRFADRIFREFFRIDDSLSASHGGAGLGLSIARDIARKHGGDVLYAPRPGGGSLFSLRLPRVP
jgi:signal transduction histidine kinase